MSTFHPQEVGRRYPATRPLPLTPLTADYIAEALVENLPRLKPTPRKSYPYSLETLYGDLYISPRDGAIKTWFERYPLLEPPGAPLQPSGEWNFESLGYDGDVALALYWLWFAAGAEE